MKMNQTSCVAMYNHVQLLVIHANQRFTSRLHPPAGENPDYEAPEVADASAAVTQLMRNICARGLKSIGLVKPRSVHHLDASSRRFSSVSRLARRLCSLHMSKQ